MYTDSSSRKSGSPRASTEISSLQLNRNKNKEGKLFNSAFIYFELF